MSSIPAELDTTGGIQAVIDTAQIAAEPRKLDDGLFAVAVPAGAQVEVIDVESITRPHAAHPARKTGNYVVHDADSFVAYMAKHQQPESEVWADVVNWRVVGVINAHEGTDGPVDAYGPEAGWGDHRVQYTITGTEAWKAWRELDGKLVDQATFAEHIEARSVDILVPPGADMLELAETFQATIGVNFESSRLLSSGERQFEYRETVDAKAGRKGQLSIPKQFTLALIPFEGAEVFKVTARFRYRIADGALRVGYRLDRPADVLREAFLRVVDTITTRVEAPVFRGVSA